MAGEAGALDRVAREVRSDDDDERKGKKGMCVNGSGGERKT